MIGEVINHLKVKLEEALNSFQQNIVHLPDGGSGEALSFGEDGLYLVIVNLEQDETNRSPNPYQRQIGEKVHSIMPDIHLNVYLLVVASYNDYLGNLNALGKVISFFQQNRAFKVDIQELNNRGGKNITEKHTIDKLHVDIVTLPLAQQNEVWNALRTHYRPSILLKLRMVVFRQPIDEGSELPPVERISYDLQTPKFWFNKRAHKLNMSLDEKLVQDYLQRKQKALDKEIKDYSIKITVPNAKAEVLAEPPNAASNGESTIQKTTVQKAITKLNSAREKELENLFKKHFDEDKFQVVFTEQGLKGNDQAEIEITWPIKTD